MKINIGELQIVRRYCDEMGKEASANDLRRLGLGEYLHPFNNNVDYLAGFADLFLELIESGEWPRTAYETAIRNYSDRAKELQTKWGVPHTYSEPKVEELLTKDRQVSGNRIECFLAERLKGLAPQPAL